MKKPPLGVLPCHIWKAKRAADLAEAIGRYTALLLSLEGQEYDTACALIHQWAKEIVELNLPREMPF